MEKKTTSPVVAGLLISLILIVYGLVIYFTGLYTETWNQYVGLLPLVGGLIWAVINHGKEKNHHVTFGNLFAFGFKTTAVVVCVMILYTIVSGYIFPDVKEKILEVSRQQQMSSPNANEAQVEQGMEFFEKNYTLFIVIIILFWYLVLGALSSLIAAAIAKKNPKPVFDNV